MSVARANSYASEMVRFEAERTGDLPLAIERIADRYGFTPSHVERARKGRLKTMDIGVFAKWRVAYLDFLQQQISKFQHQLAVERATGEFDDVELFEDEAAALVAKVAQAKAAASARILRDGPR